MEITWLGHSCFRLRQDDAVFITDPFPPSLGLAMEAGQAVAVTVSHDHPNHAHVSGVGGRPKVFYGPGEYEIQGVYIRGVLTPPADSDPADRRNTAYIFEIGGVTLCHLGDLTSPITASVAAELDPCDVLLVPAGGGCTLAVSQVAELVQSVGPRLVIPMHYKIRGLSIELGTLDPFLREMGVREVQPQARLVATPTNLPAETRVVVLEAQAMPVEVPDVSEDAPAEGF